LLISKHPLNEVMLPYTTVFIFFVFMLTLIIERSKKYAGITGLAILAMPSKKAFRKVQALLKRMTLAEKLGQLRKNHG
jgi:hypothetical protein